MCKFDLVKKNTMQDIVRFGLVGTGRITSWVLRGARENERFVAAAICSRSMERARSFAQSHDIPAAYDDLDAMLRDPQVDAVYIGTPNHTHHGIALKCLRAGKHVLCEKPLAANAEEAVEMVTEARRRGVILMEAMISTLSPNFLKAASLLKEIGPIRRYSATYCQYSSKYEALQRGEVAPSFDPLCAGGAIMDIGIYTIWPMVYLLGEPLGISGQHVLTRDLPGRGVTDLQGTIDFIYPGLNATVFYSKIADSFLPTEISGEGGSLMLDKIHICSRVTYIPHGAPASGRGKDSTGKDLTEAEAAERDDYYFEFKEFISCVLAGKESAVNSPDTSIAVLRIMDQVRKNYQ